MSYIASILKAGKWTKLKARAAAGTTTQTPAAALDMAGFDSICYFASTGDGTSGTVLELIVYGVATSAVTGGTAVTATSACTVTSVSSTDVDNGLLIADVVRWNPAYRYTYCSLTIATQNCESDGLYAIQYNSKDLPLTQGATVIASSLTVAN